MFVDTDLLPARELKSGTLIENEIEAVLVHQVRFTFLLYHFSSD